MASLSDMFFESLSAYDSWEKLFPPQLDEKDAESLFDQRSPLEKAIDSWNNMPMQPWMKVRDLAGNLDPNECGGSKHAVEIGLNFRF